MKRRIGHRGAFLALTALAFIMYGIGLGLEPAVYHHTDFFLTFLWWPRLFVTVGAVMLFAGILRPRRDDYVFALSTFISAWWAIRWFHAWYVERGIGAWPTAWTWLFITAIILLVSSWSENHRNKRKRVKDDEGEDM